MSCSIKYNSLYFNEIESWFKYYNLDLSEEYIPATSLIIPGLACGFLYLTNSPQAYIEGLCKNPYICKEDTDKALDIIINDLFDLAKSNGVKLILSITKFDVVVDRAIKLGCVAAKDKYTFLGKHLGQ